MKKTCSFLLIFLFLIFLVACEEGNQEGELNYKAQKTGLNELTVKQLKKKLDNYETFYLLSFNANKEDVDKTKLLEAYDKESKNSEIRVFYVNLNKLDDPEIKELENQYAHPQNRYWMAEAHGLVLVQNGGVGVKVGGTQVRAKSIEDKALQSKNYLDEHEIKEIRNAIQNLNKYVEQHNLKLSN